MSTEEAEKLKGYGTEEFKKGNFVLAAEKYGEAATEAKKLDSSDAEVVALITSSLSNQAACCLKLEKWAEARTSCDQVCAVNIVC